jgi:hypothetical protein
MAVSSADEVVGRGKRRQLQAISEITVIGGLRNGKRFGGEGRDLRRAVFLNGLFKRLQFRGSFLGDRHLGSSRLLLRAGNRWRRTAEIRKAAISARGLVDIVELLPRLGDILATQAV